MGHRVFEQERDERWFRHGGIPGGCRVRFIRSKARSSVKRAQEWSSVPTNKNRNADGYSLAHHDAERSTWWRSVRRPPSPIDKSCVVPILIYTSNGVTLFGQLHQGGDERYWASLRSIDCSIDRNTMWRRDPPRGGAFAAHFLQ
jgi:hypothetical protein